MAVPFTEAASAAVEWNTKALRDNIFVECPLLLFLMGKQESWMPRPGPMGADALSSPEFKRPEPELVSGGEKLEQPLVYAKTTNVDSYFGGSALNYGTQEQITKAQFDWCQMYGDVTVTDLELAKCSGPEALFNLVTAKTAITKQSIYEEMVSQIYSDGTGNSGYDIDGLLAAIATGSYGGIEETWWQAKVSSTAAVISLDIVRSLIRDCSKGNDRPTIAVTTEDLYEKLESLMDAKTAWFTMEKQHPVLYAYNFEHIMVSGVPVIFDPNCPSGNLFVLDTKYLRLKSHSQRYFNVEKIAKGPDANIHNWKIWWQGNMTCGARRKQGRRSGLTAA